MKVCKNCGEINNNDCDYCINCGKTAFIFQEEINCPNCHAVNDKSFEYCINCGMELRSQVPQTAGPEQGYSAVPVNIKDQLSDIYGGIDVSTPEETAQCPSCGALVPIHAIYCQKCGASVDKLHDHRVVKRKLCPHCGRPNSLESHFCSYCFAPLTNAETQEMQVVHETKNIGTDVMKTALLEDEHGKKKICTNCGALNATDELFCVNCGFKLDAEEQRKYCPNCGAENDLTDAFCIRCQWSFDGVAPDSSEKWECSKCHNLNDEKNGFCVACGTKKNTGRKK